jgi:antitoxin (DNA-binding transcriptional repressor) of toxin-antitoxin stability system
MVRLVDFQRPVYILVGTWRWRLVMNIEVGSYEAKTKLPELLRGIQAGHRYTITLRGEAVADLVPAQGNKGSDAAAAVIDMLSFMQAHKLVQGIDLKALINEGRA